MFLNKEKKLTCYYFVSSLLNLMELYNNSPMTLKLEDMNKHPRDEFITFEPGPHTYQIHGEDGFVSVTTLIHGLFPPFDGAKIAKAMVENKNFPKAYAYKKYRHLLKPGQTTEERVKLILQAWDKLRDEAASLGTIMHSTIERHFNEPVPGKLPSRTPEMNMFHEFAKEQIRVGKRPYRTEWMIYDEEFRVCGSVDMIFRDADGFFYIVDWKRSKKISKWGKWDGYGPLQEFGKRVSNCNFSHYTLQLNIYKYILEKRYGIKIKGMSIVVLHPNASKYEEHQIDDRSELAAKCVQHHYFTRTFGIPQNV